MNDPLVRFGVRIKSKLSFGEIALRIGKALNCSMELVCESDADPPIYESKLLGFRVTLGFWPYLEEGELRTYALVGNPCRRPLEEWTEIVDISDFILNTLRENDSANWYIPSKQELLKG